jgi:hypothetical protein
MGISEVLTRIYQIEVTVPAGTLSSAPQVTPWFTEDAIIGDIELLIPSGPNGSTGIRVMKGDVQLIPWGEPGWLIGNDYNRSFPIGGYLPTSDVSIQTYNDGQYDHTFYLRMSVTTDTSAQTATTPVADLTIEAGSATSPADPLSPDAILGPALTAGLASGDLTSGAPAPIEEPANISVAPELPS